MGVTPGADAVLPDVPVQYAACCCGLRLKLAGVRAASPTGADTPEERWEGPTGDCAAPLVATPGPEAPLAPPEDPEEDAVAAGVEPVDWAPAATVPGVTEPPVPVDAWDWVPTTPAVDAPR